MGDKRNYAALDWVIGEIGETLKDARHSLESYVEDPRDTARIRFCLTHIHQVHGSLQMVEFHGASLFAEEMELLAEAIMNGRVINDKEAHEALMRSLLQLPLYLEQVKAHHEDHPGAVLPLLNDLRAVRKESYLSETNLFNPDLSSLSQIRGERHPVLQEQAKLKQIIHKLREMYQYAAASVLRGIKIDESLVYLEKVSTRLEGITRGTASHPTWQVSAALIEALVRDDVELSIAVRGLLRYLARELKILEEHCPSALDAPARESLLRNLLYYVARAEDGGARVAQVKRQYGLDKAVLGGGSSRQQVGRGLVSPPEPDAIKAVVLALQDELNTCKHLLDLALTGQGGMSDLEEMLPYVKRISDTLAVLGIGELRKQTLVQFDALAMICQSGEYSDGALLDIAGGLADIENRLEAIAKGVSKNRDYANVNEREVEVDSAKEALLGQCRAGLETVKNAIVESMSGQWDPSHLPPAIETLHYVYGGLNMVPLHRPAVVLDTCGQFIHQHLLAAEATPTQDLQTLAEAIASIDYFLERLEAGHGDDLDIYLDMAEASLAQLGYSVGDEADTEANERAQETDSSALPGIASEGLSESDDAEGPPLEPSIDSAVSENDDEAAIAEVEPEPLAEPDMTAEALPLEEVIEQTPQPAEADEESDIDAEIIEIFIEEADEVLETLADAFPKWRENMDDESLLTTIRRAFHTLKGSGRMVEAYDVGELAWAIENMLNRLLDGTVEPQDAHAQLIERVLELVPTLVEAFKNQQPNPDPRAQSQYIAWAEQLAEGTVPEALTGSGEYRDYVPEAVEENVPSDSANNEEDASENQALWEIFASEANTHLQIIDAYVAEMDAAAPLYSLPTDDLQRALHTLKGSAHMAAVTPIAAMITPLEGFIKELRSYQLRIDDDILQLLKDASSYTRQGLDCIDRHEPVTLPKLEQFVARVDELYDRYIAPLIHMREQGAMADGQNADPTLLTAFMSDDMNLLLEADRLVRQWQQSDGIDPQQLVELSTELRQLHDVAVQANLPELQQLAELLRDIYAGLNAQQIAVSPELFDALAPAHETLLDMFDQVAAAMTVQPASGELQDRLRGLLPTPTDDVAGGVVGGEGDTYEDFEFADSADSFSAEDFGAVSEDSHKGFDIATDFIGEGFSEDEIAAAHDAENEQYAPFQETVDSAAASNEGLGDSQLAEDQGDEPIGTFAEQDYNAPADTEFAATEASADEGAEASENMFAPDSATAQEETYAEQDVSADEPLETFAEQDYNAPADTEFTATETSADEGAEAPDDMFAPDSATAQEETYAEQDVSADEHADLVAASDEGLGGAQPVDEQVDEPVETFAEQDYNAPADTEFTATEASADEGAEAPDDMFAPDSATAQEQTYAEQDVSADEHEELASELESPLTAYSEEPSANEEPSATAYNEEPSAAVDEEPSEERNKEPSAEGNEQPSATDQRDIEEPSADSEQPEESVAISAAQDVAYIEEGEFDPDILEIFLEEAGELIEELDEAIHNWESDWDDKDAPETMKRALHTLKGGARLSGLRNLGELTHDYESYLIAVGDPNRDKDFFSAIHAYQDNLLTGVRGVRAYLDGAPAPEAPASVPPPPPAASAEEAPEADEHEYEHVPDSPSAEIVPFNRVEEAPEVDDEDGFIAPRQQPKMATMVTNKRQGPQEMIKVPADLLEELVNLAGETSISRGRLEQQVSDLGSAVDEVDGTLRRLNEQLRRLDLETDAQVLFRQEQMAAHEGFDPLEMDRYSQLQQLTRSLMESASDLGDLKITLTDKIKDTETLLLQQSRINSALQEGLMRSRMVPFSRLVPRLRRIVRQVSGELGKHVNFELDNVEGEMDRSVLERMVAPLEHMLRNAVDHGIEMPDERLRNGKPETGRILLSLAREGGDILLRMADDGRGIHLDRVREKAIERGLMTADAELSDYAVMQFILQAGFSTAENVTQISGRGVGMDVVAAEIKQLGGSIVIDSKTGVGTQFTVRLPFTVSVNRALMVQLGAETYAIPLNTIEGIVRVSPFELEHYYNHPDARFEYAGENYRVRHLGTMLNHEMQPKLEGQVLPLPVILVRSAQHTMALQVDGLMGSREIVVKSLGPQFAAVQGLSGATVMGDGSVVVILDPHALVRRDVAQSALPAPVKKVPAPVEMAPALKTIMVVDDSVTVRKVTSRFLEREGYNVVTAKDGVDALQLLQEEVPDLMLLDIEMPRMDGFEVAKNIRSTRRLKHLPIIMITSRTGDKHRQHALSIGVNDYMGKPYQEEALLRAMQSLLAKQSATA